MKQVIQLENGKTIFHFTYTGEFNREIVAQFFKDVAISLDEEECDNLLVLNISALAYIDSNFIGKIFELSEILTNNGGKLAIICTQQSIVDILKTVGATKVIPVHENLDEVKKVFVD